MNITKSTQTIVLASLFVCITFLWQGNKGFNLWDEGFLWYGAQRVMLGEVPIRDFMAYDPGRYYWSATLMGLWGNNGIMSLRGTVAIFQTIGLFIGLLLIAQSEKKPSFIYLMLSAISLLVWMYPRHKLFDITLSIILIGVLTFLIQKPSSRRYFFTGFGIGLVAIFGRNHGIYGAVASTGAILWLGIKRVEEPGLIKAIVFWAAGVVVGFAPLLLMALFVPGFAIAFWDSIRFLFEVKATNLPLPVPWPWNVQFASLSLGEVIRGLLVGLFFMALIIYGILSIIWVFWRKFQNQYVSPVLVATSFLALPYAHYAYSRADAGHLAHGIFPLLIGCFALIAMQPDKIKWTLVITLCTANLWTMHVLHPGWQCRDSKQCMKVLVSGSNLLVDSSTANDISLLRRLVGQYAPNGQSFVATPFWPGAYALFELKSPMWEIYALFPSSQVSQQKELVRIKQTNPLFAIINDFPLDGRDELRFQNTHSMIYQYIQNHFNRLPDSPNPNYQIYTAKGNG